MAETQGPQLSYEIHSIGEEEIPIPVFYRNPLTGGKDSDNGLKTMPWFKSSR
jgi:hypothetical protein